MRLVVSAIVLSTIVTASTVCAIGIVAVCLVTSRRIRSSLAIVLWLSGIADGSVTDHSVLDHNVRSIIELKIWDSALRLDFEEAGITLLESFDPNTLAITYSRKIKVGSISTLTFDEGANLKFINRVVEGARASPVCISGV